MFVTPSHIKQNKLLRGRTISFETPNKTHGNMVIIPTLDREAYINCIDSKLFRPMQLMALYVPRRIKPRGRQVVTINQKDYYSKMRADTNGRIKKGKTLMASYNAQNLVYDFYTPYSIKADALSKLKKMRALQHELITMMEDEIYTASHDPDYQNTYLVFPLARSFPNPQRIFVSGMDISTTDPVALFIASIIRGEINLEKYENIKMVFFYVPKDDVLMAVDIHNPDFLGKIWPTFQQRLKRMNALNSGEETLLTLADDLEDEDQGLASLSPEDRLENKKEEIKIAALSKVAKDIRANTLTDFEAATRDERDLMSAIDAKIDTYLAKPENLKKTIKDMVTDLEQDTEIKTKSLRYVETKKANAIRATTLAKGLEKEDDIIDTLTAGSEDSDILEPKEFKVAVKDFDKRMSVSHLSTMDKEYKEKQLDKDIINVVSAFSNTEYSPLTVDNISFEDTSNYQNEIRTMKVRYKTDDGKPLSFSLDIPKIVDDRFLYLGGNKYVIKKQIYRLPITKVKPDTVEITTNVNKMTITRVGTNLSRRNAYLFKKLEEIKKLPGVSIEFGDSRTINGKLGYNNDFEYEEIGGKILSISTPEYYILFNRDKMQEELDVLDLPENFISSDMTPLGISREGENTTGVLFIEDEKVHLYSLEKGETSEVAENLFSFLIDSVLKLDMSSIPTIGKSFIYTQLRFLKKNYPVLTICASQVGLTNVMDRYKIKYYFTSKPEKRTDYISVKFKDKYLNYEGTIQNTLLMNALPLMSPQEYEYAQFDADIPYTHYFMKLLGPSIGIHTRNTMRFNLDVIVDPITRDVLRDLRQPTNIIDMLLYANTLLVGTTYKPLNDLTNYRIRGSETVPAVMYKLIADSYVNYQRHKVNGDPANLTLPKDSLRSALIASPNINSKSTLNPVHEAEEIAQASAKGHTGVNIDDAYTLEMRAYDESMAGFLSGNATPFSGSAGITRSLSYDPKITSIRGYIPKVEENTLSAANLLSPTELLAAYTSAGADAPRQAMQVAQTGHTMPVLHSSKQLIGSGMNKTLASLVSDDFCFKAKKDGILEKIDNKNRIAILKYIDGVYDSIDLEDKFSKNANMGFFIHSKPKLVYKEGESFKEGDVLAYMPEYFSGKGNNVDYRPGPLAKVAIASGDFSFEDATMISETLSEKCASNINIRTDIAFEKSATIHKLVHRGDHVVTGESIIEYTNGFEDPDTAEFLLKLGASIGDAALDKVTKEEITTMYSGEVTNVEIFYNCPYEELSPSLQKIISEYRNEKVSRENAVKGKNFSSNVHVPPLTQFKGNRVETKEFPADGGVIIRITVEYVDKMGMGDKLTYSTALKGVCSRVLEKDESPLCDYRPEEPIEAILTPTRNYLEDDAAIYTLSYSGIRSWLS